MMNYDEADAIIAAMRGMVDDSVAEHVETPGRSYSEDSATLVTALKSFDMDDMNVLFLAALRQLSMTQFAVTLEGEPSYERDAVIVDELLAAGLNEDEDLLPEKIMPLTVRDLRGLLIAALGTIATERMKPTSH